MVAFFVAADLLFIRAVVHYKGPLKPLLTDLN